jgi:hypothetical protein
VKYKGDFYMSEQNENENIEKKNDDDCVFLIYGEAYYYRNQKSVTQVSKESKKKVEEDVKESKESIKEEYDDDNNNAKEQLLNETIKRQLGEISKDFVFNPEMGFLQHLAVIYNKNLLSFQKDRDDILFSIPSFSSPQAKKQTLSVKFMFYGDVETAEEEFWNIAEEMVQSTYNDKHGNFEINYDSKILTTRNAAKETFKEGKKLILEDTFKLYGLNPENFDIDNLYKETMNKDNEDDEDDDGMTII